VFVAIVLLCAFLMTIENRVRRERRADGSRYVVSEYRLRTDKAQESAA
jgi:hypothetical protein